MNKNDLIASVASSAGLSKSDSTRAIESLLDAVTNSLKRDEKVSIVGLVISVLATEKPLWVEILEQVNLSKFLRPKDQSLL